MTENYIHTELGELPENWKVVRLGEYSKIFSGYAFKSEDFVKEGILVVKIGNLQNGTIVIDNRTNFFPREKLNESIKKFLLNEGDILIAMTGATTGKISVVPKNFEGSLLNQRVGKFKIYNENLNYLFLRFFATTKEFQENVIGNIQKSAQGNISPKIIENLPIPLPPLSEQEKIAAVLDAAQRAIEATEKVISALKDLKKSAMKHLFTFGPVPFGQSDTVNLKETEIGKIPEHWEVKKLGEVCEVKGGKRIPKGYFLYDKPTQYPYIRIVDFKSNSVSKKNLKYINSEIKELLRRYIITKDDVYISIAGTIGLVGTIPQDLDGANLTENACRLIIKNKRALNKNYLVYYLDSNIGQKEIALRYTKTSQPKLALMRVRDIPTMISPLQEQEQIAFILGGIDSRIEAEEKKLAGYRELFRSLLRELMSARVRVKDINVSHREHKDHKEKPL